MSRCVDEWVEGVLIKLPPFELPRETILELPEGPPAASLCLRRSSRGSLSEKDLLLLVPERRAFGAETQAVSRARSLRSPEHVRVFSPRATGNKLLFGQATPYDASRVVSTKDMRGYKKRTQNGTTTPPNSPAACGKIPDRLDLAHLKEMAGDP